MATISNQHANTGMYATSLLNIAIDQPDIYAKLIKQFSNQYRDTIALDLRLAGSEIGIPSESHSNFLEGWFMDSFVSDGGAAASAPGGTQAIVVDAVSMTSGKFYPKTGHVIMYKGTSNITGVIESIDYATNTLTVRAAAGVTLPIVANHETLIVISSAWGEGSNQPVSSAKTYERLDYYLQIIKDTVGITGSEMTNDSWVKFDGEGGSFDHYNIGLADLEARQDQMEEGALLFGNGLLHTPTNTSPLLSDDATTFRQTKGVIPWIRERGLVLPVTPVGFDYTDLNAIDDYLRSQGDTSKVVFGWLGNILGRAISNYIFTNTIDQNTNAIDTMLSHKGFSAADIEARAGHMNYREIQLFDRTYCIKSVDGLSNPKTFAADGYLTNQYGIWFPASNVKGSDGNIYANVSLMYKAKGSNNRRREFWEEGAAGGNSKMYIGQSDSRKSYLRSHIGLRFALPNQGILFDPEA